MCRNRSSTWTIYYYIPILLITSGYGIEVAVKY